MFPLRAIVLSGGRLPKRLSIKCGVQVKSLIPYEGKRLLQIAVDSALGVEEIAQPVAVVGPEEVKPYLKGYENRVVWLMEGASIVDNVERGARYLGYENNFLLISPDLPLLTPSALREFISGLPPEVDLSVGVIPRSDFVRAFPNCPNRFARLADGDFTMGSVFFATGSTLRKNLGLLKDAYKARKNLLKLAMIIGLPIAISFLFKRAKISDIEDRISFLTDSRAKCVILRNPYLAYDIDNELNLKYLAELKEKHEQAVK